MSLYPHPGAGVQWSNVRDGVSVDDDFSMFDVMIMLAIDTLIYGIITWYVEAIFPGEYGVAQKWYFPFTVSIQCLILLIQNFCVVNKLTISHSLVFVSCDSPYFQR